jgi:hypothetical protein
MLKSIDAQRSYLYNRGRGRGAAEAVVVAVAVAVADSKVSTRCFLLFFRTVREEGDMRKSSHCSQERFPVSRAAPDILKRD